MAQRIHASLTLPAQANDAWHLLRVGHISCAAGYRIDRQRHAGHEWLLVLRGSGTAWCGEFHASARPGELLWLDNLQPHGHQADHADPWELLWLRCHGPDLARWRERLGGGCCLRVVPTDPSLIATRIRDLLTLAQERDRQPSDPWNLRIQAGLTGLLAEIAGAAGPDAARSADPAVARCQAAMLADLAGRWQVDRLVTTARLPSSSLYRRFERVCGLAPLAWLQRRRLERAADLLGRTRRPVAEIAAAVGFPDPFHFSRAFHAAFGLAPRDYRRAESGG
jgi:AraC-like DNA-binding protein